MKTSYPTVAQLLARLQATGIDVPATLDLGAILEAAIDWWESETRFVPFLVPADTEPTTLAFSEARKGFLSFGCGLICSEDVAITVDGTLLTEGTDYKLHRDSLDVTGPWTWAEMLNSVGKEFGIIEVEGVVGWGSSIPSTVNEWILSRAIADCLPYMNLSQSKGFKSIKIGNGDLAVDFGDGGAAGRTDFEKKAERFARKYRLKTL